MKIVVNGNTVFDKDITLTPINKVIVGSSRGTHVEIPIVDTNHDIFLDFVYASLQLAPLDLQGTPAEVSLADIRADEDDSLTKALDEKVQEAKDSVESFDAPVEEVKTPEFPVLDEQGNPVV
jgi:hypothetical protein